MRTSLTTSALVGFGFYFGAFALEPFSTAGQLLVPALGLDVDLSTGTVARNGISGPCIETVSKAGRNTLVIARSPGDDHPSISINGMPSEFLTVAGENARLGTIRLARDGSLVHLRTWKTGKKQTELLRDGAVKLSWKAGTTVRLLQMTDTALFLLVYENGKPAKLQKYAINNEGAFMASSETLVDFKDCHPSRLRLVEDTAWAEMICGPDQMRGIYRISLTTGDISGPVVTADTAEFVSLPRTEAAGHDVMVGVVSGSPSALQFYYAVMGLLLSQTGEVRACASDAEGLQSWNQSYRARALALLYRKTGAELFADLTLKSLRLTLAAQDGAHDRSGPENPHCGWSSRIYSENGEDRLSLMINQAIIANALSNSCKDLGDACPAADRTQISATEQCLADAFEADFDETEGLYRIQKGIDFRFAGAYAPWNWQVSFAAMLKDLPDTRLQSRADRIIQSFLGEMSSNEDGSLWRYWPYAYYRESGYDSARIAEERFEDTGHAGISLLGLKPFDAAGESLTEPSVRRRSNYLHKYGDLTPRDLDGSGPRSERWHPSGGWADFASKGMRQSYSAPVPGTTSADVLYAYARLFDPAADFRLSLDIYACDQTCQPFRKVTHENWQSFLNRNPFFSYIAMDTESE